MIVPIGIVIPPSIKAIIRMTTSPVFLLSAHSPWATYLMPIVGEILYLALNLSLSSSDSTKHLNLPIILRSFEEKLMSSKRKIEARRKSMMKKECMERNNTKRVRGNLKA